MELKINYPVINQITKTALSSPNKEICGLLLGINKDNELRGLEFHQVENISKYDSEIDYQMNPQQVMNILKNTKKFNKKLNIELIGIVHSHPNGLAFPSMVDINQVAYKLPYLIFGVAENKL